MAITVRVALLLATTVVTISTSASNADAQIFRRLRDNIRANIAQQPGPVAPPQALRPQTPYQVAPRPNPQYGQQLTPYSRLTPAQRQPASRSNANVAATPQATQRNNASASSAAAASPNQSGTTNVRIVTYYDPRTGRTFQRRYIVPPTSNGNTNAAVQNRQLATRETSASGGRSVQVDRIPAATPNTQSPISTSTQANSQQPQFNIPPIASSQPTNGGVNLSSTEETFLPVLAGPSIDANKSDNDFSSTAIQSSQAAVSSPMQVPDDSPIEMSQEIRIDTSVAPASTTSDDNQAIEISSASSVDPSEDSPVVFSVLERDDDAAPQAIEVEMNSDDEDVDAFFNN